MLSYPDDWAPKFVIGEKDLHHVDLNTIQAQVLILIHLLKIKNPRIEIALVHNYAIYRPLTNNRMSLPPLQKMRPSSSSATRNNPNSFGYNNSSDEETAATAMSAADRLRLTRPAAVAATVVGPALQHNHPPYATGTHKNR